MADDTKTDRPFERLGIEQIEQRIVDGETLRSIAKSVGRHPAALTRWIAADQQRADRIAQARRASADTFAEQALELLANAQTVADIARAREQASHLRWMASKRNPSEYAERVRREISGPDGAPVETLTHQKATLHIYLPDNGRDELPIEPETPRQLPMKSMLALPG